MEITLQDVAIRWQGTQWYAYNAGEPTPYATPDWSTAIGDITVEEILMLFGSARIIFLPATSKT
jgi:hypothetical protein